MSALPALNFGAFEAGSNEIKDAYKTKYNRDYTLVGGESVDMVRERQQSFLKYLFETYNDETILLSSHGFAVWLMITDLVYNGQKVDITMKNACYNILDYKDGKWNAIVLNEVGEIE